MFVFYRTFSFSGYYPVLNHHASTMMIGSIENSKGISVVIITICPNKPGLLQKTSCFTHCFQKNLFKKFMSFSRKIVLCPDCLFLSISSFCSVFCPSSYVYLFDFYCQLPYLFLCGSQPDVPFTLSIYALTRC